MTEISEDMFDVAFGMFFAVALTVVSLQFTLAGFVLLWFDYLFAAAGVLIIAAWVIVFTLGMITEGKARQALKFIGMFEDSEPIDVVAERLWSEN